MNESRRTSSFSSVSRFKAERSSFLPSTASMLEELVPAARVDGRRVTPLMDAFTLAETAERAVAPRCIEAGAGPDWLGVRRGAGDDLGEVVDATILIDLRALTNSRWPGVAVRKERKKEE